MADVGLICARTHLARRLGKEQRDAVQLRGARGHDVLGRELGHRRLLQGEHAGRGGEGVHFARAGGTSHDRAELLLVAYQGLLIRNART